MTQPATRVGPRPLPLHLAAEGWILQSSFAGLMSLNAVSPPSKEAEALQPLAAPLQAVLAESLGRKPDAGAWPASLDAAAFIDALTREARARMEAFTAGVRAYQSHPYRRTLAEPPSVWRRGAARLLDYGGPDNAPAVVVVPSLVNRAFILDLAEDRSFLRTAAASGLRTFLLDWGAPGPAELAFTMEDYALGVLIPALAEVRNRTNQVPRLAGYCMGGTLAVIPAVLRPELVSALAVLAAPWDFHAGGGAARIFLNLYRPLLEGIIAIHGCAPVDLLQALFAALDPTLAGRKFRGFTALDPQSDHARRFVELEDWLNDGIPLAGPVATESLFGWYMDNKPAAGTWTIAGSPMDPGRVTAPTLALIPSQDRIVPPESALALAAAIPGAATRTVPLGHIGMMAGGQAKTQVYLPLIEWLKHPA